MNVRLVRLLDRRVGIPLCRLVAVSLRRGNTRPPVPQPPAVRRILLMKWVGFGNIVLATPAIAAVRERFPDAEVTFVTLTANRGLLERYPMVDRVFYFDVSGIRSVMRETLRLLRFARGQRFDVVMDFEQFSRYSALVSALSGAPVTVGFDTPGQGRGTMYSHPVPYKGGTHMADVFGDLARVVGAQPESTRLIPASATEDDFRAAEDFLESNGLLDRPFVVIHPGTGANAPQRRWPVENYALLADRIVREAGLAVVFSGSPREKELVDSVRARMDAPAASTAGTLGLAAFGALLRRAQMLVCSDSGPVHLASALSVPALAFYGPNDPNLYGPLGADHTVFYKGLECSPCITNLNDKSTSCPHGDCIRSITVDEAYIAIQRKPVPRD